MSLLSQASLVVVPSGYKEDVVYSVKPTDGSGDLTFTRASDGTRVNSQGLVERVPWNLLQYSEDFTSGWSAVNSSITANSTTAPNGTTTADTFTLTASSDSSIYQPVNGSTNNYSVSIYAKYVSGDKYLYIFSPLNSQSAKVWFDIQNGTVSNQLSGFTGTIENAGNGWYRCSLYNTNQAVLDYIQLGISTTNSSRILSNNSVSYIWGAQVNSGTAKPYFPTTDRLNVPRLDYSGGCPSLLLEPQRTNLALYSEQFDNAAWTKVRTTITANNTISPDGTQNADKLESTASAGQAVEVYQSFTTTAQLYTASVYLKQGSGATDMNRLDVYDIGTGTYKVRVTINFSTGVITQSVGTGATVENVGDGWYRISAPFTALAGLTYVYVGSDGTHFASGAYTYAWGAQLEAGSYATSYIPTTSASVTRVADAAYKTGISSLIGQTEGTLFVDLNRSFVTETYDRYAVLDDADGSVFRTGVFVLPEPSVNGRIYIILRNNSTDVWQYTFNNTTNQRLKIAVAYKSGDIALYINGAQEATSTTTYTLAHTLQQVKHSGNSIAVNQTVLFKTRLTNAELAALTTL